MANMLDNLAVRSISKHRNKLMSLVESTKKRKKKKHKSWTIPPSNIEHLVFKKLPTSPIDTCPSFNETLLDDSRAYYDTEDADEEDSADDLNSPNFTGSYANILCKRVVSTSDSQQTKVNQRPVSVADCQIDASPLSKTLETPNDLIGTASDTTSSEEQKNLTSLDLIWRANPVNYRIHSRLLKSGHKKRYKLRRSISQPVELEMAGSIQNLRDSSHVSADQKSFPKLSLSSDDDEVSSDSDIYHSYSCSPTRRSSACWEVAADGFLFAEALWDHETVDTEELPFQAGDIIEVTDTGDEDWWWGTKNGQGGWFPSNFVKLFETNKTSSLQFTGNPSETLQIPYSPCKESIINLSAEQVRANIVQEIVATERDYVKHLKDVVEGYLKQVLRRPDMFSKERIEALFGNIKEIYLFQSQFLKQLEECLVKDSPHLSQIGTCFLNHKEEFKMYSQYCNNHPLAVNELQELYCDSQYIHFFEACRLLQEMIDISLDGFLLTPIQRICKYPLQLAELLKYTDSDHPDYVPVKNAWAAMKEVAELVNERKRRMECLERLAEWQNTIEGWEGPDILDTSSILIHCGEVTRVSSSWSRDIYLFIFDHQLIYCKKDLLKRQTYVYKGRLNLDHCDIVDAEDGRDSQFAVNIKNAWKIYCKDKEKWYLFYVKTFPEKEEWLAAFKAERQRVADDKKQAFVVTEQAKKSAILAVHNKQKPKKPRAKFSKGRQCHPDVAVTELLLDSPRTKSRSGSLPSNIHPELAIMAGAKLLPTRKKGSGWFHFGSGKKTKS